MTKKLTACGVLLIFLLTFLAMGTIPWILIVCPVAAKQSLGVFVAVQLPFVVVVSLYFNMAIKELRELWRETN